MIGTTLAHYRITAALGAGGMGEVWRATDEKLGREVALKVLPPEMASDPDKIDRFRREARALATLDHPGIVTVFSVEEANGINFLTMQLVEGKSLSRMIPENGFDRETFVGLAKEITDAIVSAHENGVVHRDLKPANVMVDDAGRVKVLDFGLAKLRSVGDTDDSSELPTEALTGYGVIMGTVPYMSPEQVEGRPVDDRSDVFSLGVLLYEMATGRRPFQSQSSAGLLSAILRDAPQPVHSFRTGFPKDLAQLVDRCLEKDPRQRPSAATVRKSLQVHDEAGRRLRQSALARPITVVALGIAVIALAGVSVLSTVGRNRDAAFVAEAIPQIERLGREGRYERAFDLADEVVSVAGSDAVSEELWDEISIRLSIESEPAGAKVLVRPFAGGDEWKTLGVTPLSSIRVAGGALHWRAEMEGRQTADLVTTSTGDVLRFELRPVDAPDADMLLIPGGEVQLWALGGVEAEPSVVLEPFLIDRGEVTNREFARFVEAGGYTRQEFWQQEFAGEGQTLSFAEAMDRFRDATGRPGPATWSLGSYLDGSEELPVSGISWFEADAYATFAGKELPTMYHWYWADNGGDLQLLPGITLPRANFESGGPRTDGAADAISVNGATNMAGNVREWCSNQSESGDRLAVGGAWTDPSYVYLLPVMRSPFEREAGNGLRCIKRRGDAPLPETATRALRNIPIPDFVNHQPVSDEVYEVFTRLFDRQPVDLKPEIEEIDESSRHWIRQRISFAAGYGGERITVLLYLPRSAQPPYQTVVQMGGAGAFYRKSSASEDDIFSWRYAEYMIRGGRAVALPIWKGSYERSDGFAPLKSSLDEYREHLQWWVTELRQTLDYLESRDDIDAQRIAFQGMSFGAMWSPLLMALEPRFRCGVVLMGGCIVIRTPATPFPPEYDILNYAPRVRAPVLMLNGRNDAIFPYEISQVPMFRAFGAPDDLKRHVTFESGHSSYGWRDELFREGLDWLDTHFGPVTPAPRGATP